MSQIGVETHAERIGPAPAHVAARSRLTPDDLRIEPGLMRLPANVLLFVGAVFVLVTFVAAFGAVPAKHALAAHMTGFLYVLAAGLGSLGYVMIFHQTNAGWSATIRRQFENVMAVVPWLSLLLLPVLILEVFVFRGALFTWLDPANATDPLLIGKRPFLNQWGWLIRSAVYFALWTWLCRSLYRYSRTQDETGDRWLTAKARRLSAGGLLVFALSTAFASFDWAMSLDYHWFSTMFGVYFFASAMLTSTSLIILILASLKVRGRLVNAITDEHFHDLGKLLFTFTVFWAYISFFQYFLIWYSNIPEETGWFWVRQHNGWQQLFLLLSLGQFVGPFVILLFRGVKRNPRMLMAVAAWVAAVQAVNMFFTIRPVVYPDGIHFGWVDAVGILGPVCVFMGLVLRRIASAPLVPLKDPRLDEALNHKNYV